MRKTAILAICAAAGALAALATSCNPKTVAATPGAAAKQYVEHIMNDDYEAFVEAISFTEPVPQATAKAAKKAHAEALRAIHHPNVAERGGIREVKVVSEKPSADNRECEVTVASHYNDGLVKTVNMHMVNDYDVWKVRETPYREIWRSTSSEGDTEVVKVRNGQGGEKQFIKDINHHNGEVEVIKVLENGQRHREVIRAIPDATVVDTQAK